jgi:hypothetical protein
MEIISVTYASSPSSDLLIQTLEFDNETAGMIRLTKLVITTRLKILRRLLAG